MTDQIIFDLCNIAELARGLEPTKRNIVSLIGKFYDPLGFLAPIVVTFKIFIQALCEAKIDWDDSIPGKLLVKWSDLVSALTEAQPLTLPRCYLHMIEEEIYSYSLCGYCDASLSAYAAVVYLMIETSVGAQMRLVTAKTRVSPLKKQTIPRLELLSAVCCQEFLPKGVDKSWKPFVQNSEIRELIPVENPADVPSRGVKPLDLIVNILWRDGPSPPVRETLIEECNSETIPTDCIEELKASEQKLYLSLLNIDASCVSKILKIEDFSSVHRLVNVFTIVLKFCSIIKARTRAGTPTSFDGTEHQAAEQLLIAEAQSSLTKHKNFKQWSKQLMLFEDENGLLRCQGRIGKSLLPYSAKYPILLPRNHHLTELFILEAHSRVLHNGTKETLVELRSRFWIMRGRSAVKGVLRHCTVCRRYEGQAYRLLQPPPLPAFRVQEAPPFAHTAVDFAGPLYVKFNEGRQSKVWIGLYTCCITRAIHLDLVPDIPQQRLFEALRDSPLGEDYLN